MEKISTVELFDGTIATIKDTENYKALRSKDYNFFFNKKDGFFVRFGHGEPVELDRKVSKQEMDLYVLWCNIWKEKFDIKQFIGDLETEPPIDKTIIEICDIEIAEICEGTPKTGPCSYCYKGNTGFKGTNMSFETYKKIFSKLPISCTQIAFGTGTLRRHPEMWDIMKYTRDNGVIPNLTINGDCSDEELKKISEIAGACAVSLHDKELGYNTIEKLSNLGMKQVNIHQVIYLENFDETMQILKDVLLDPRLKALKAIVLLNLKTKGRASKGFTKLPQEKYNELIKFALENNIGLGSDSCGAQKFLNAIQDRPDAKHLETYIETCESTLTSAYINVHGNFYACSFDETDDNGLSVLNCDDFMKEIWFHKKTREFSEGVIKCKRCKIGCSIFDV